MASVYFGEGGKLTWRWFVPVMPRFGDVEAICGYCVQYCNVCCVCGYSLCECQEGDRIINQGVYEAFTVKGYWTTIISQTVIDNYQC